MTGKDAKERKVLMQSQFAADDVKRRDEFCVVLLLLLLEPPELAQSTCIESVCYVNVTSSE